MGVASGVAATVAAGVAAAVAAGVAAVVIAGLAVVPVSASWGVLGEVAVGVKEKNPGDGTALGDVPVFVNVGVLTGVMVYALGEMTDGEGLGMMVGARLAAEVAAGVSVGVSVGVAGRAMGGVGTSLAWLAGTGEGEGLVVGVLGAGAGAEGQRPQVAAQ